MLSFTKDYFEDEVREDFLVDSTMKTLWAAGLELLADIADICAKYQLPWFADWGTLLGAVRHKGYVPWDDDLDISMLRPDYEKLLEVLQQELPEGYIVHHAKCGHEQDQFWAYVTNSDSVSIEPERLQKFHGCPFIVGIDIYPLDYLPRDPKVAEAENALFKLVWKAVHLAKEEEPTQKQKKDLTDALRAIESHCNVKFDREKNLVTQLCKVANDVISSHSDADSDELVLYLSYMYRPHVRYDKEWFYDMEYLPFESVELPVPWKYHEVLTREYGDYMVRVRNGAAHDYPYYKKQLERLRQIMEERKI